MNKQKFNTSLAVVIAIIIIGGFFGLQNWFMSDLSVDYNPNPNQNSSLGIFANMDVPEPSGDPSKVTEAVFLGGLSELDLALMADDSVLMQDYQTIINQTSEIYENEI